jgi:hypothetical protein
MVWALGVGLKEAWVRLITHSAVSGVYFPQYLKLSGDFFLSRHTAILYLLHVSNPSFIQASSLVPENDRAGGYPM